MFWLLAVGTLKPRSAAGKARNNAKNCRPLKTVGRKKCSCVQDIMENFLTFASPDEVSNISI